MTNYPKLDFNNKNIYNELNNLLASSEADITFWGGRVIKSENATESNTNANVITISLNTIITKVFKSIPKHNSDLENPEKLMITNLCQLLVRLKKESDTKLASKCWFTRCLNYIREFYIFNYSPKYYLGKNLPLVR